MLRRYTQSIMLYFAMINSITARYCGNCRNSDPGNSNNPSQSKEVLSVKTVTPTPSGHSDADVKRKNCCPYEFDSRNCRVVNDRVLCGYDKNVGKPYNNQQEINLSQGCRIRGGRLECGYVHPPFTNPRRPPGNDNGSDNNNNIDNNNESNDDDYLSDNNGAHTDSNGTPTDADDIKERLIQIVTTPKSPRAVTRCVEIHDRIVCRGLV